MDAERLSTHIGRTLRRLRKRRGWTLDQLAAATGVSKPMLGQIERGESNPTVLTLWKVARGLRVPFSTFLQGLQEPTVTVVKREAQAVVVDDDGRYEVRGGLALSGSHPVDLFQVRLAPSSVHTADEHGPYVLEGIWVTRGQLCLSVGEQTLDLAEGDAAHFSADVPHSYRNPSTNEECEFFVLLAYGEGEAGPRT
jgi:transcriptional regulator with XRE-family HTH domain